MHIHMYMYVLSCMQMRGVRDRDYSDDYIGGEKSDNTSVM